MQKLEMQQVLREDNRIRSEDRAVHDWYRFVLSFPPHLVQDYLRKFRLSKDSTVLDPFCGTGTTLVECKKLGYSSVGIESNPMAFFASQIKVNWEVDFIGLQHHSSLMAKEATEKTEWKPGVLRKLPVES